MQPSTFQQVLDYASRSNPYPLYEKLRAKPVWAEDNGGYVVSRYREVHALLHDPRMSSDASKGSREGENTAPGFLSSDPPEHDLLRRLAMRQFGPPHCPGRVDAMRSDMAEKVNRLLDGCRGKNRIDIVDDFAYPFPVSMICDLLGVPPADEPQFSAWAEKLVNGLDADPMAGGGDAQREAAQAAGEIGQYMAGLAQSHAMNPGSDILSGLMTDDGPDGRMALPDVVKTGILLLVAGHETTVNLITNGSLTLLRHPDVLERVRSEPELVIPLVEELLRFEPPVQMTVRTALSDVTVADTSIPRGTSVTLLIASGNRDPERFERPDQFVPDRADNQHLGFGSGIHSCFGAPMARLEAQTALLALVRRLDNPRLVTDPPPYRLSPILRGPRHLFVDLDGVSG